jgi:hypothetical protein
MGTGGLCVGIAFAVLYIFGLRTTGVEVDGGRGGPIWWANLRPVHSALYLTFGAFALKGDKRSWIPLAIDVGVGLVAFAAQVSGL